MYVCVFGTFGLYGPAVRLVASTETRSCLFLDLLPHIPPKLVVSAQSCHKCKLLLPPVCPKLHTQLFSPVQNKKNLTRRALGIRPTKVFRRLVNKNLLKPRFAAAAGGQYVYVGFSRRKIPLSSAYTISEKAIRFRHPDYNPDRAQKLISFSVSRHLSTSMHIFLSNLAHRQRDRQTNTGKNIDLLLCRR